MTTCIAMFVFLVFLQFIPSSGKSSRSGVRSLSESEEKKMDDAIKLANAYAAKSTSQDLIHPPSTPSPKSPGDSLSDHSHGESDCNSSMNSLKFRSVFRKSKTKSPKQEKKSYTEEIASISDAAEVTPEAQEAYNMLIGCGSIKEKDSPQQQRRRNSREARVNRSMEHHSSTTTTHTTTERQPERPPVRNTRNQNLHIREPQGIPTRRISGVQQESSEEVDVNPLRRLRESATIIPPRSSHVAKLPMDHHRTGPKVAPKTAPKPILSANTSFFDKLKEQERESQESSQDSHEGSEEGSINIIPLPPRMSRSCVGSQKQPYERKYPLDMSNYNGHHQNSHMTSNERSSSAFTSRALPPDPGSENDDLNSTRDSEDSIFSDDRSHNSSPLDISRASQQLNSYRLVPSPTPPSVSRSSSNSQFSVKSVKLSAKDLGYLDTSDLFWSKDVSLQELGSPLEQTQTPMIPGRYKTSDTVSYEDLLEFALDGVSVARYFMLPFVFVFYVCILLLLVFGAYNFTS